MIAGLLTRFAIEGSPTVHVAPGTDFTIAGIPITNAMFYGWICTISIIIFLIWAARKVTVKPQGGVVQYVEAGVEFVTNFVEGSFTDPAVGRKYVPFFVTLFFFVLFNNWSELIPVVGDGIQLHGHPLFRPVTADLNMTLAIGLVTMLVVYAASIKETGGPIKYLRHFFIGNLLNPLYLVIGIIEIITDLTRVFSLSLRLFLNITIGEIVIIVFAFLGGALLPHSVLSPVTAVPFWLLELGVGVLQAYIFAILGTNYLAIAVNSAQDHTHDDLTEGGPPETIEVAAREAVGG
ncbi:MAG TPA: F0F1 ATP synthase subunit A [Verrucomicrobiae bacterium]|nr:F0F1 ATP synthase subunit A [Verrucomicrobiae bacterium]